MAKASYIIWANVGFLEILCSLVTSDSDFSTNYILYTSFRIIIILVNNYYFQLIFHFWIINYHNYIVVIISLWAGLFKWLKSTGGEDLPVSDQRLMGKSHSHVIMLCVMWYFRPEHSLNVAPPRVTITDTGRYIIN